MVVLQLSHESHELQHGIMLLYKTFKKLFFCTRLIANRLTADTIDRRGPDNNRKCNPLIDRLLASALIRFVPFAVHILAFLYLCDQCDQLFLDEFN